MYSFQDDSIGTDPHIIVNNNLGLLSMLEAHQRLETRSVVVIDKPRSGSDETIRSNENSPPDVELAARADERAMADHDARPGLPCAIELELNSVFQPARISYPDLVRPGHMQFRKSRS